MPEKVNYNPDILSCLANLSSDEVFTPPEIANAMLDMLPQELFRSPDTKFLDPGCKSGVFLREIAKRLNEGLKDQIPDLEQRMDHIMKKQLFAIAITQITSLLSRRSLYCSKDASSRFSVARFENPAGNIQFRRIEHTWVDGRCSICGASQEKQDRGEELETHAYEFIHMDDKKLKELRDMKFDVIIGNPPYQLNDGGGNGASAKPIYQLFVQQSLKLNPRYISMITPSRWFSGGKGLDEYRDEMLKNNHIRIIHDYPDATNIFPGIQLKGGASYFLWDRDNCGLCKVYSHSTSDNQTIPVERPLLEKGCDTFIRYNEAIPILHKVQAKNESSFSRLVSQRMPFGLPNTYKGNRTRVDKTDLETYVSGNDRDIRGTLSYTPFSLVIKGKELISCHKVFIGKAGSGSDSFPHPILPQPFYGKPMSICNESYLVIGGFGSEKECKNVMSYIATRFFRFMVLLKKNSQNAAKGVYELVPMQDFSKPWTDEELYKKYALSKEEIEFIESLIRPMSLGGADA